jgi:hypothetical protein
MRFSEFRSSAVPVVEEEEVVGPPSGSFAEQKRD